VKNKCGYEGTAYDLKSHNCRTFSHTVAAFLGVEDRYLEIIRREKFMWAERPELGNVCQVSLK